MSQTTSRKCLTMVAEDGGQTEEESNHSQEVPEDGGHTNESNHIQEVPDDGGQTEEESNRSQQVTHDGGQPEDTGQPTNSCQPKANFYLFEAPNNLKLVVPWLKSRIHKGRA